MGVQIGVSLFRQTTKDSCFECGLLGYSIWGFWGLGMRLWGLGFGFGDEALGLGWGGVGTRCMPTGLRASLENSSLKRRHPEPYRDICIYICVCRGYIGKMEKKMESMGI